MPGSGTALPACVSHRHCLSTHCLPPTPRTGHGPGTGRDDGWPGQLDTVLRASRRVYVDWKGTGVGRSGTEATTSQISGVQGLAHFAPKPLLCASLPELEEREWSTVGCAEAAAGWEPAFLALSGVQGGPHCITLGASVPDFAASWAPGGGTLPVFQQTINHFTLLVLPTANLDSPGCPSRLSAPILETSLLLHDAQGFCPGSLSSVEDSA